MRLAYPTVALIVLCIVAVVQSMRSRRTSA